MTQQPDYKTLDGGSIDYAFYLQRGRIARAGAFHALLPGLAPR